LLQPSSVIVISPTGKDALVVIYSIRHFIFDNLSPSPLYCRNYFCRFLPDKAIDLVDEACAKLKNEITSKPMILDEIDRRVIQLEMERLSLQSDYEKDEESKNAVAKDEGARLERIDAELEDLKIEQAELNMKWMVEKGGVDKLKEIKEKIQIEIDQCERDFDLNKAAELKYSTLPSLEEQLAKFEQLQEGKTEGGERMLRDEVVADDIAAVVAVWTGIPAQRLLTTERDRILTMDAKLRERVIGQEEAIQVVTEAVQRSRAGLNDPSKPIASLMFLGPTGVGKTEMSKALAEFMFDDEDSLIRIDMSEYMEKHTVSRLLGAPPGYVGYDEGGQLTEAVRRQPYAVLLFDEIEKAHPDVFNVMLQLLDDGRLTDSKGTTVNFRNTICIFTSNIGSSDILDLGGSTEIGDQEIMKQRVKAAMENHFKPEFLNRIDESVIFNGLSKKDLRFIVKIETKRLEKRLEERQIKLAMSEASLDYLADVGFDPVYGARPLKRAIQRELETVVARGILSGAFNDGDTVVVEMLEGRIGVRRGAPQENPAALSGAFD
jgi:ATP-dependent Clp protease ATP-binding subunit ClpB